jgi:mannosyltransferase OCH1-like enzyme
MIPRVIHQCWLGGEMPKEVRQWVESVGRHHPGWSHIIWDEAMLRDIGIRADTKAASYGSYAAATNEIRLELLYRFGGVWLDTDMEALAPIDPLLFYQKDALAAFQDGGRVCNAFMGAKRGSDWIRWQLDNFNKFDSKDPASGVYLATAAPGEGLGLVPQQFVYPWLYDSPPDRRVPHRDSVLCHHWQGSWNK